MLRSIPSVFSPLALYVALASGCGGTFEPADPAPPAVAVGDDAPADVAPDAPPDVPLDAADADGGACACVTDLSHIGLADFYIAFTIQTTNTTAPMAILNQRLVGVPCNDASIPFWDVHTGYVAPGQPDIYVAVGGGGGTFNEVAAPYAVHPFNDGQPHRVVIARTQAGTRYRITVDGDGSPATGLAPQDIIASLGPLAIGTDAPCGMPPLDGTIKNVCITVNCPIQ